MAGFTTLQCNGECSSQGMHKVLCELREGSSLSLGSWKGLVEEMALFVLGLLKDMEELVGQEESVPHKDAA